jgi:carboxypeptidase PM20D1
MLINILIILFVLILFMLAFMLFRTVTFARSLEPVEPAIEMEVDAAAIAKRLAGALRYQTIFPVDGNPTGFMAFLDLQSYVMQAYPKANLTLDRQRIGDYSLVYIWKGSQPDLPPVVLMAHQDVVPVDPATLGEWEHPPFEGVIADGYVWGRGSQDCKMQMVTLLETVEHLLETGYQPARTIYLAFGHDEEIGGIFGAKAIVAWFEEQGIHPAAVLDEGMAVTEGIIPGVDTPIGLIGIAEKGLLTLDITVKSTPGHSAQPPRETAIGILAKALAFIEASPLPARLDNAMMLFKGLGPVLPFRLQFVFANLWLFGRQVRKNLEKNPATNAMIRTTTAITMIQSGIKINVLPSLANAKVNFRLLPGDTIAGVCERIRKIIDDERVTFEPMQAFISEPSSYSRSDSPAFQILARTIRQSFDGVPVAPMLVLGGTDSRYYHPICDSVYRFSPLVFSPDELKRVHGINERVSIAGLGKMVQFYGQLIQNWAVPFEEVN